VSSQPIVRRSSPATITTTRRTRTRDDCRPALGRFSRRPPPHPRQRHRRPPPRPTAPRSPSSSSRCYARRSSPRRQHTKARSTPATNPSSPGDARASHERHLHVGDVHASLRYDPGLRYTAAASPKLPARRFGSYQLRSTSPEFWVFSVLECPSFRRFAAAAVSSASSVIILRDAAAVSRRPPAAREPASGAAPRDRAYASYILTSATPPPPDTQIHALVVLAPPPTPTSTRAPPVSAIRR